jgi:ribosomal protein S4
MPPSWLKVDASKLRAEVSGVPQADDFEQAIDVRQVIEFYSRR